MKTEVSFRVYSTEEFFLDTLKNQYLELFPKSIRYFDCIINFLDEIEIQRSEDVTEATIMATDTITGILLPEFSFSIIQEQTDDEWRLIVVTLYPYHDRTVEDKFLKFASDVAGEFTGASVWSVDVSVELFKRKGSVWNGETYGVIARQINVYKEIIPLLIRIEENHIPQGLKQREMGEEENFSERTINKYIGIMKEHPGLFPNTAKKYEKFT